jgi:hypothetical protein
MRCNAASELMGHNPTDAPQQAAPLFDLHTGRRSPFPCILSRDRLP